MIISISDTSKPDVTVGLLRLSHQPPLRLQFIWPHSSKEDQVLYKIQRKKVISTQGGGLQVFSNISQAIHLKTELLAACGLPRVAAPRSPLDRAVGGGRGQYRQNCSLTQRLSCELNRNPIRPSWREPWRLQQGS